MPIGAAVGGLFGGGSGLATAVGLGSVVSNIIGSNNASDAATDASNAQIQASQQDIAERQRQFNEIQKLLAPYVQGGTSAFGGQQALLGLSGANAQNDAIQNIQNSPMFTNLVKQGENALLQNASATGGLRGGNTQNALMQYRPQLLSQLIGERFNQLGAISQQGLGAATQTGAFGQAASSGIGNAYQNIGAAQAGNALAQGRNTGVIGALGSGLGAYLGAGGTFGGGGGYLTPNVSGSNPANPLSSYSGIF